MKLNFRTIAKLGLLLVVIGFTMPIACDQNGFQIANYMMDEEMVVEGVLFYVLFISAIIGVIIGVLLLANKKCNPTVDWIIIIVCIASGLYLYFTQFQDSGVDLQNGAYVILAGWIVAVVFQIISSIKKE